MHTVKSMCALFYLTKCKKDDGKSGKINKMKKMKMKIRRKNIPKIIISNDTVWKSLWENLISKEMNSSAWNS